MFLQTFPVYFHSEYLMESWHLKVESDFLKFSLLNFLSMQHSFASAQLQEYVPLVTSSNGELSTA